MIERPPHDPGNRDCGCFRCHVGSIQISPAALPTRRNNLPPSGTKNNSYENAVPTDHRGVPYLGPDLKPVSQRSFDRSRHRREQAIRHPESVKDTKDT